MQVKSTDCRTQYGYLCQFKPNAHGKPYTLKEIDFFAAYVIPREVWYVIPAKVLLGSEGKLALTLLPENPKSPERYGHEGYREGLLRPQASEPQEKRPAGKRERAGAKWQSVYAAQRLKPG